MTKKLLVLSLLLSGMNPMTALAVEGASPPIVAEVRASLGEYVEAFNRGDAEALAQFWAEDATYEGAGGESVRGRGEVLRFYRKLFTNNPGVRMQVADSAIEPASEGWARETGTDILTYADGSVEESPYSALLRKVGDNWLIQSVVDLDVSDEPTHHQALEALDWLIGVWRETEEGVVVETTYEWTSKKNSILGRFSIRTSEGLDRDGIVVIGWDPIDRNIRSWFFDSDGGTAVGVWYEKDGKWFSKAAHVLPDGETGSSTRVFEKVDDNTIRWRAINRQVGGEMLPTVGPITLTRVK
ncbi:MAG: hypothetical protein GHCLOJNM_01204 [bacterium]|nr:hypothetical protein [bacterium]